MNQNKEVKEVIFQEKCNFIKHTKSYRTYSAKIRNKIIEQRVHKFRQQVFRRKLKIEANARVRRKSKGTQVPEPNSKVFVPIPGYALFQRYQRQGYIRAKEKENTILPKNASVNSEKRENKERRTNEIYLPVGAKNDGLRHLSGLCHVISHSGENSDRIPRGRTYVSVLNVCPIILLIFLLFLK